MISELEKCQFDRVSDPARLRGLRLAKLLDTPPEASFDRLTQLASRICDAPVALVSLVDDVRQFFKSQVGLPEPWATRRETPLTHSFCREVVRLDHALVVQDARSHPLVRENPAIRDLGVIAYLGTPIRDDEGLVLGSFCVIDTVSRKWTAEQISRMNDLSESIMSEVRLRKQIEVMKNGRDERAVIESRLRTVIDSSADGIITLDERGYIIDLNPSVQRLLGHPPEHLIGRPFSEEFIPQSERSHRRHPLVRAGRRDYPDGGDRTETFLIHREGHVVPVEVTIGPMAVDPPYLTTVFLRDLTDWRRLTDSLREKQQHYQALVGAMEEGIVMMNNESRITDCNASAERILGLSRSEILERGTFDPRCRLLSSDGTPMQPEDHPLELVFRSGERVSNASLGIHKPNGEVVWLSVNVAPVTLPGQDRPTFVVCSFTDVSERRHTEAALRESEERFRSVADTCPVFIWTLDAEGRCDFTNEQAHCFNGDRDPDNLAAGWRDRIHPDDRDRHFAAFASSMRERIDLQVESRFKRSDGVYRWLDSYGRPRFDIHGEFLGFVGCSLDVTDRITTAETLRRAKEVAEAANRAKSQFLANVSHEIRTPMNCIIHMTDFTLETELNDEQRENLSEVKNSADSLMSIIEDLLDFSKIEAGRLNLVTESFDLRDKVAEVMRVLALKASLKDLELAYRFDPDVPVRVEGDPHRLRQILLNLVGNAVKFTNSGEVVVEVRVMERRGNNVWLGFAVRDTGIGIAQDQLELIFSPFHQADGSATRSHGGTGLGLSISQHLAELMGGSLAVESDLGVGSTFRFTTRMQLGRPPEITATPLDTETKPRFALVLDDHEPSRRSVAELLEGLGFEVALAADVRSALDRTLTTTPSSKIETLFFVDTSLPDTDGFAFVQSLLQAGIDLNSVVMLLPYASLMADSARCRQLGLEHFLTKPLRRTDLIETLAKVSGRPILPPPTRLVSTPILDSQSMPNPLESSVVILVDDPVERDSIRQSLDGNGVVISHMAIDLNSVLPLVETLENPDPILLWDDLCTRFDGDLGLIGELVAILADEVVEHLGNLKAAVKAGDAKAIADLAHTLRGAVGNFDSPACFNLAAGLEQAAKRADLRTAAGFVVELAVSVTDLVVALKNRLDQAAHDASA